jgi:hypothetical protein
MGSAIQSQHADIADRRVAPSVGRVRCPKHAFVPNAQPAPTPPGGNVFWPQLELDGDWPADILQCEWGEDHPPVPKPLLRDDSSSLRPRTRACPC